MILIFQKPIIWESDISPFEGLWNLNIRTGVSCLDKSGFSYLSVVKCLYIQVRSDALVIDPVDQGYLVNSFH